MPDNLPPKREAPPASFEGYPTLAALERELLETAMRHARLPWIFGVEPAVFIRGFREMQEALGDIPFTDEEAARQGHPNWLLKCVAITPRPGFIGWRKETAHGADHARQLDR